MRKKALVIILVVAAHLSSVFAADSASDPMRLRALEVLRHELYHADPWVRVHAAEELLQLSYPEGVAEVFRNELDSHGSLPQYRIGIRRVLARASVVPQQRQERIAEIKAIFFDLNAPDRMHAIETLGKLGVRLTDAELADVRRYAQNSADPFAFWVLARHADPTAVAELERMQAVGDPLSALRAALCLEQLRPGLAEAWRAAGGEERLHALLTSAQPAERVKGCQEVGQFGRRDDSALLSPLLQDADADVRVYAASGILRMERRSVYRLGIADGLVIGGYFLSLILIGWYYARRTGTADDYLLGGRNMKPWMVGLSLFAALLSTASYMSVPGEIVKHGPMIMAQLICIPLVIWVVGWFLIPAFMKLRITSANELLELRLGLSVRMLGSAFFLFSRIAWMSMIIYITVKAVLMPITGLEPAWFPWMCVLLGVITMAYTSSGGLKAAVLADVIQSFIL